ncbi:beta-galactosidase [Sandarakinorhabdus oryzae]|uniref:beta-galactosidase n=1 Tax=Sandarakinorhabdus oryzae TaxID=2675220 RepID=UPI0012E1FAFB|nr:beta-galactosidase [Sandarakinorhabdus oryzae]
MKLGVCWYPEQWPEPLWASDVQRMAALGLTFVRVGEFAWSRIEPEPGHFDWAWLDRAVALAHAAGLEVVMGTPTATPPKWLVDAHPEILAKGRDGQVRGFGSRRHYCFSSDVYLEQARRITALMAQRYGQHPAVVAWQTDNEYGCHDTVVSTSDAAKAGFRRWLAERYGNVQALNTAWGLAFWSQEYRNFDAVDAPFGTVTESHPAHRLDWQRFSSAMVERFNAAQVAILRAASPGRDIIHNFMGLFTEFDHFAVGRQLDVAAWDSYPIGFLGQGPFSRDEKARYLRTGHPDLTAFHHSLYRACGQGRWWVIEQQPGPVNWAAWNPAPAKGAVELWGWEAVAHGAERMSWFRWRQAPTGQEAMHAGLNRPDNQPAAAWPEVEALAAGLAQLGPLPERGRSDVALVFDYDSVWAVQSQPQGRDQDALATAMAWHTAARRLGLSVDIVPPDADLAGYALVLLPAQIVLDQALAQRLSDSGARVVAGPRTGSKSRDFAIPSGLPPDGLRALIDVTVARVESLPPGIVLPAGNAGQVTGWMEDVEAGADVETLLILDDGRGLWFARGRAHYLAGQVDAGLLRRIIGQVAATAGLAPNDLGPDVRVERRGNLNFLFNYGPQPVALEQQLVIGRNPVPPAGVAIWKDEAP